MRFKRHKPILGDEQLRSGFLFRKKCILEECRWLERACWMEKYTTYIDFNNGKCISRWVPIRWCND